MDQEHLIVSSQDPIGLILVEVHVLPNTATETQDASRLPGRTGPEAPILITRTMDGDVAEAGWSKSQCIIMTFAKYDLERFAQVAATGLLRGTGLQLLSIVRILQVPLLWSAEQPTVQDLQLWLEVAQSLLPCA